MWLLIVFIDKAGFLTHLVNLDLPSLFEDTVKDVNKAVLMMLEPQTDYILVQTLLLKGRAVPK